MLKGGYTFEKYSVALPYKEGDEVINGSCSQRSQRLACSLSYGSCVFGQTDRNTHDVK